MPAFLAAQGFAARRIHHTLGDLGEELETARNLTDFNKVYTIMGGLLTEYEIGVILECMCGRAECDWVLFPAC